MIKRPLKILFVTAMYPHPENPGYGAFVMHQAEHLRLLGHCVDVLDFLGYRSKLNYIKAGLDVFQKTGLDSYDVVHAHYGLSGLPALFRWRTPLVVTLHGSDVLVGKLEPLISRCVCRFADAVIVVAKHIARVVPGHLIPCGVDFEVFKPHDQAKARARLQFPRDRKLVLFPFDPAKGVKRHDLAKAAVDRLALNGHDVGLLVVSGINNTEMPLYYSAADVMILCSDSEGSPTSVKEALACNLPVVSTDVGDVREIMRGIPGTFICSQTVEALADGLDQVLRRKPAFVFDSCSAMQRYDQRHTADSIVNVYREVIRKQNHRFSPT